MKHIHIIQTIFIIILNLFVSILSYAQTTEPVKGQLILSFQHHVSHTEPGGRHTQFGIATVDAISNAAQCTAVHTIKRSTDGKGGIYKLYFNENADIMQLVHAYEETGLFRAAAPDYTATLAGVPNDTLFNRQWSLQNDGSFNENKAKPGADIDMLRAWEVEDGDSSIIMAVIDAGLKMDHPEFAGRLWHNSNEIAGNGIDDDNNGYTDDTLGWNIVTGTSDPADDLGHGTFVAGIAAANTNNTTGYAGVDQHCKIMVIKACDNQGMLQYSWMIEAIVYATDNGANVINFSAGGFIDHPVLKDAVKYANDHGVLIVAASGNFGSSNKMYPAGYDEVIAVGATGCTDTVADFSNYGSHIDVVAPGDGVYSLSHLSDTGSVYSYGTSFATPHVTGIATLLLAQDKTRTPAQVKQLIENNAEDMVGSSRDLPGWDEYYGYGRVNAYRALTNEALGIKVKVNNDDLKIFPVPATDKLYIHAVNRKTAQINMVNVSGVTVYSGIMNSDLHAINVSPFARGNYMITIEKDGMKEVRKIILQ